MRTYHALLASLLVTCLAASLSACERKDGTGPAETAGKEIDQATAKTNATLKQAGEKISQDAVVLTRKTGEKMEQAGQKMQNAADRDQDRDQSQNQSQDQEAGQGRQ